MSWTGKGAYLSDEEKIALGLNLQGIDANPQDKWRDLWMYIMEGHYDGTIEVTRAAGLLDRLNNLVCLEGGAKG